MITCSEKKKRVRRSRFTWNGSSLNLDIIYGLRQLVLDTMKFSIQHALTVLLELLKAPSLIEHIVPLECFFRQYWKTLHTVWWQCIHHFLVWSQRWFRPASGFIDLWPVIPHAVVVCEECICNRSAWSSESEIVCSISFTFWGEV